MSVQIRRRGDTTAAHQTFTGAEREITIDTDKKVVVVHDGETVGGFPLAREDMSNITADNIASRGIAKYDLSNVSAASIKSRGGLLAADLVGMIIAAPLGSFTGFLLCNGAAVSRTSYAALFAKLGTTFGEGDGSTTFNIPDYRGYFLRGKGGNSADDFITAQGDAIRNITGRFDGNTNDNNANKAGAFYVYSTASVGADGGSGPGVVGFDASRVVPTAAENRPVNKAVNFFIKY